jgi:chromosome segregation ATPase
MNQDDVDILNLSEAGRAALARIASLEDERDTAQQTATYLRRDIDAVTATKRTLEADVARLGNDAARLATERDAARAEVSDLIAMLDGMQSMLTQAGRVAARAEADHVATIDRLRQAERERDEVGIQFVAARERLGLALVAVAKLRAFRDALTWRDDGEWGIIGLRVINGLDLNALTDASQAALAALDDVPGDVKAP